MNHKVLANGDLLLTAGNADRSALAEQCRKGYYQAECHIAECYHERLYFVSPESIGALTDAPILCDDMDYSDCQLSAVPQADARVWWFPDYMVRDPWQELARYGRVRFSRAESSL